MPVLFEESWDVSLLESGLWALSSSCLLFGSGGPRETTEEDGTTEDDKLEEGPNPKPWRPPDAVPSDRLPVDARELHRKREDALPAVQGLARPAASCGERNGRPLLARDAAHLAWLRNAYRGLGGVEWF